MNFVRKVLMTGCLFAMLASPAAAYANPVQTSPREDIPVVAVTASTYSNIAISKVANYVNVRTEANTHSEIVGKMYNNCAAKILATVDGEGGKWYQIQSGNVTGYIKAEYFITGAAAEKIAKEIGTVYVTINTTTLRLREQASTDSRTLTLLSRDAQYIGIGEEGDFVEIEVDASLSGYVHKDYIQEQVVFDSAVSLEEEQQKLAETERLKKEAEDAIAVMNQIKASVQTAAPAETAAPADTAASTDTAAPAETAAPADTAASADTAAPAETIAPAEIIAPADTAAPSEGSAAAEAPAETIAPSGDAAGQAPAADAPVGVIAANPNSSSQTDVTAEAPAAPEATEITTNVAAAPAAPEQTGSTGGPDPASGQAQAGPGASEQEVTAGPGAASTQITQNTAAGPGSAELTSATRNAIVAYAKQFLGNPYVFGGTSLTNGTDCSGYTMRIFEHFGIDTGRSSRDQAANGKPIAISDIQPGDLLFYANGDYINHVALYIGNGQIIHASNSKTGIIISTAYYRTPYKAVTFLD